MRSLLLKAGATALTLAAAASSALYVGGHVRSGSAPLHPTVVAAAGGRSGKLSLSSGVTTGGVEAVTSTYAS